MGVRRLMHVKLGVPEIKMVEIPRALSLFSNGGPWAEQLHQHIFFFLSCHSSYVRFDILQRILSRLFGITVIHAMVITDIDDKIINRSAEVRS